MVKSICMFNHKGGVSKTTTTFNLGWSMATKGKKVLMVDLDAQCNLSGLVLGFDSLSEDAGLIDFYAKRENLHMGSIVEALVEGVSPDSFLSTNKGGVYKTSQEGLFLLPGNLSVADLDAQISVSLKIAMGVPATRNIPGNLPKVLKMVAEKLGVDYILYDLSPNVGGLNEVVLMSSDYFIVPTSPDFYCWQAIGSLATHIPIWHEEIRRFKEANKFGADFSIKNQPTFIGAIQQRYRPRNGSAAKSFELWIERIRNEIKDTLVPKLNELGCAIDLETFQTIVSTSGLQPYDLANIADFNSLIAMSQKLSKPVFALTDSDIRDSGQFGHALETMKDNRDTFNEEFNQLSDKVIRLTQ